MFRKTEQREREISQCFVRNDKILLWYRMKKKPARISDHKKTLVSHLAHMYILKLVFRRARHEKKSKEVSQFTSLAPST